MNPILEFHYYCKAKNSPVRYWPSKEVSARLLEHIDARMQRYFIKKLRVRTLRLRFPNTCEELGYKVEEFSRKFEELCSKVDEWIRIAVCNQVAILRLDGPISYQLPDILLSANSLRRLDCANVELPYFNKAINLASLQTLVLFNVVVEEDLLNHIISSSLLLKCLSVEVEVCVGFKSKNCVGFKNIVIPCCSRLEELTLTEALPKDGTIIIETSSLTDFQFSDLNFDDRWPVISKPGLLRNLTVLGIFSPGITDEELGILLPELVALEILQLSNCHRLRTIRVSCIRLKEIYLNDCDGLLNIVIDAPCLTKFKYPSSWNTRIALSTSWQESKLENEEVLVRDCPLVLFRTSLGRVLDLLSIEHLIVIYRPLMSELQKMAKCWSHPLKRVEVEGSNCSNLLKSSKLVVQFRLYW